MARSLPLATAGMIGLCCSVYVSQIVLDVNVRHFTMCPRLVLYLQHYYRIVTSCFFHGSIMHIGMNMVSTAAIAALLERRLGTMLLTLTVLWSVLITGVLALVLALGTQWIIGSDSLMNQHSLGFSGIMFHLLVLESNLTSSHGTGGVASSSSSSSTRSVFGFVTVPSYAYPIVMLGVMQVIMPNVSFSGHLCGIIAGMLQLYGLLDCLFVKDSFLQEMEQWRCLRNLTSKENFVPAPVINTTSGENNALLRRDPKTLLRGIRRGCQWGGNLLCTGKEKLCVIIFGRGRRSNSNIHLMNATNPWASLPSSSTTADGVSVEEDEENTRGGLHRDDDEQQPTQVSQIL